MAAAAVCLARGIDAGAVVRGLRTFAGVAHRLELIAVRDGVSYVNDSKATNVASTAVALRSYANGVHLIAGGSGKQQDFTPLAPLVARRCAAVYLIGEAARRPRAGAGSGRRRDSPVRSAGAGVARRRRGREPGRHGPAVAGLRELRPVRELRGAR